MVSVDDFRNAIAPFPARCPIWKLRQPGVLKDDELEAMNQALADESIPGVVVADVLKSWGYDMSRRAPQRHRRGDCGCDERV